MDWFVKLRKLDGAEDSEYHKRLKRTNGLYIENRPANLHIEDLDYNFPQIIRWYDPTDIRLDDSGLGQEEIFIWKGTHAYCMKNYESALLHFNDAFETSADVYKKGLLLLNMARSYRHLADPAWMTIRDILHQSPEAGVRSLAAALADPGTSIA